MQLVHESAPAVRRDRLLRLPEVEALTGLRKSQIYALMRQDPPAFPRNVRLSTKCSVWPESRVLTFIQDRIAEADALQLVADGQAREAAR